MANRFPLTLNTSSSTIEELPAGDNLDLASSNVVNAGNISAGNNISANTLTGSLVTASQPNITSVGVLGSLTSTGTISGSNLTTTGNANVGTLRVSNTSNLGSISNVFITGGSANQAIITNGSGNLSFGTINSDSFMLRPVRAASLQNITLSGTQTIDGVALTVGDRVLVFRQTTATENGIYTVASGAWTRTTDFNTGALTLSGGVTVTVVDGTNLAGVTFYCTNTGTITIGSTSINFNRSVNTGYANIWTATNYDARANASANSGAMAFGVYAVGGTDSTAMGYNATTQNFGVSYGYFASTSGLYGAAIGHSAVAGLSSISMGYQAGTSATARSVSLGHQTLFSTGSANTVSVGFNAGRTNLGLNSVAIGANAANQGGTYGNTITINATGTDLNPASANSMFVKPIRAVTDVTGFKQLYYNPTTGEIVYYNI